MSFMLATLATLHVGHRLVDRLAVADRDDPNDPTLPIDGVDDAEPAHAILSQARELAP